MVTSPQASGVVAVVFFLALLLWQLLKLVRAVREHYALRREREACLDAIAREAETLYPQLDDEGQQRLVAELMEMGLTVRITEQGDAE